MGNLFKCLLFLLCTTFLCNTALLQEIKLSGVVLDRISRQPLPNATVRVAGITNKGFQYTMQTTARGIYQLSVPLAGYYTIQISYLGYRPAKLDSLLIDNTQSTIPAILLTLERKEIDSITVTAKKPFIVVTPDMITLNVAQSPVAAGGSIYDILKMGPGVLEQNDHLTFRGKTVNVLINGRPRQLSGEDLKNMLSAMPAGAVEKIEILPNPSARYDAQGGAVINIVLVKNKAYGTNYLLTAGAGAGKYLRANSGIDINSRREKLNITAGYDFSGNNQYIQTGSMRYLPGASIDADEYEERKRQNNAYRFTFDYDLNKRSAIGIMVNGALNARRRDAVNTSILDHHYAPQDSLTRVLTSGDALTSSPAVNLYYRTSFNSPGKELTLNADYMNHHKRWNDDFVNRFYDPYGKEYMNPLYIRDHSPGNIHVYAVSADYVHPVKQGRWEAGVKTSYTYTDNNVLWENDHGAGWQIDEGKTNHFVYRENVNAIYVSATKTINKWRIQAGLRTEQTNTEGRSLTTGEVNRNSYINLFPNINLSYTTLQNNTAGITYRKNITRFGFDYVNPFIIFQNAFAYSQGNPKLQPQIGHQLSATWSFNWGLLAGFDYVRSVKALGVSFRSVNNITISTYDNFNSSQVYYAYINYFKQLFSVWQTNLALAYGYFSFDVNSATAVSETKNSNPFSSLNIRNMFFFKKGWGVECNVSWVSTLASGIFKRQPWYSADLGISRNLLKNRITVKAGCTDVFNTLATNVTVNYQGVTMDKNRKEESRFFNLVIKYRFGNQYVKRKAERASAIEDIRGRIN